MLSLFLSFPFFFLAIHLDINEGDSHEREANFDHFLAYYGLIITMTKLSPFSPWQTPSPESNLHNNPHFRSLIPSNHQKNVSECKCFAKSGPPSLES